MIKITRLGRNCLGTADIEAQFEGMRKPQSFSVYPMRDEQDDPRVMIQSDTRIGFINLSDGAVEMTPPYKSGAYFVHLIYRKPAGRLDAETLLRVKMHIASTNGSLVGGVCKTRNDGAIKALSY